LTLEIFYGDENFTKADPARREEMLRRMGILFQSGALWRSMTLAENVGLPLEEFTDLRPAEIREIAFLKLALVGLKGFEDYCPSEISGGMQKRAGLAATLDKNANDLSSDLQQTSAVARQTMVEIETAAKQVGITMKEGEGTLASARAVIDPESPTFYELTKSLHEVSGAARSLRLLADYLERNPRALIFGKPKVNNGE
jgi:ABC-type polar amino acid transport system ATPase subunit